MQESLSVGLELQQRSEGYTSEVRCHEQTSGSHCRTTDDLMNGMSQEVIRRTFFRAGSRNLALALALAIGFLVCITRRDDV